MVKKPSKAQKAKLRKAAASAEANEAPGAKAGRGGSARGRGRGRTGAAGGGRVARSGLLPPDQQAAFEARKRTVQLEESAFSKLSPPVLERLNILASYADLSRPIPTELTQFDYSRFGRARAENHQRIVDREQNQKRERDSHPLAGWLEGQSGNPKGAPPKDVLSDQESDDDVDESRDLGVTGIEETGELRLPKRPKWRTDMETKTILAQEQEVFRQWLRKTDAVVERAFFTSSPLFAGLTSHTRSQDKAAFSDVTPSAIGGSRMVSDIASRDSISQLLQHRPSPGTSVIGSLYERNIEVYRQLWRVCERSDLVCVLADARCPLLHLPPSLVGFLERYMRLKVIIVLTKADIVPKHIVDSWKHYLKQLYPRWEVVATESYAKLERMEGQGSRARFAPYLSPHSRRDLFAALRKAHEDLITPPKVLREGTGTSREWLPPCATDTDWEGVERRVQLHTEGFDAEELANQQHVDQGNDSDEYHPSTAPGTASGVSNEAQQTRSHLPYLTIGLIGQPNVGKSSLLNALFGSKVVRASKTPGKTKHFQTHFLIPLSSPSSSTTATSSATPDAAERPKARGEESHRGQIRLCDSPGLVFPSLIGMEMQVMGAILAISQVQAITSCVRFVAEHIALEKVLQLDYPPNDDGEEVEEKEGERVWTGLKILEAVARRYMFKTAKANRWDVNRAGNLVMRAVAEGRIKWAFRPPSELQSGGSGMGDGIWISEPSTDGVEQDGVSGADVLTAPNPDDDDEHDADEGERKGTEQGGEGDSDEEGAISRKVRFDFGAVPSDDGGEEEEDEDEESDEEQGRGRVGAGTTSLFRALAVEDGDDDDDEEAEEDGSEVVVEEDDDDEEV